MSVSPAHTLHEFYDKLYARFGPQQWWPATSRFEVVIGAILTQNTNWGNVERALANLKRAKLLNVASLLRLPQSQLAKQIKPAGYFNIKAKRIKNFLYLLEHEYGGKLECMKKEDAATLRAKLLAVNGIGPETADSILLYAFDRPYFVIDAYTKRFLYRHNIAAHDADYHQLQNLFTTHLPSGDTKIFNEYHALIVRLGKDYCRPTPKCVECPLNKTRYSLKRKCATCHRALIVKDKIHNQRISCPTCGG